MQEDDFKFISMSEQNAVHLASPDTYIKYAIQTSVCPIHDTGKGPCSSLNMCILIQLLIFTFWSLLRPFFKLRPSNFVQLEH